MTAVNRHPGLDPGSRFFFERGERVAGPRVEPGVTKWMGVWPWPALVLLLAALSLLRPVNHDESQYVAATVLAARGLLPYRDFAYLQTPLQPLLFAPIAWAAGAWVWPALRLVNALCGAIAAWGVHRAAREAGADRRAALVAVGLFVGSDALLFGIGTARNDALPMALLACALPLVIRADREGAAPGRALLAGLLLSAAVAAKISYALPALAYGGWALLRPRHRAPLVAAGALAPALLVLWLYLVAPEGFRYGVLDFPVRGPLQWYADRPYRLTLARKALDAAKFLALGAGLPALLLVARRPRPALLGVLLAAGLVAALCPTPTWRQYMLPALPPLFALLAVRLSERPPGRAGRIALMAFAGAGLTPTVAGLVDDRLSLGEAMRWSAAAREAMDRAGVGGPVATLSPQLLPATGRLPLSDYAPGPFHFRGRALLDPAAERRLHLASRADPRLGGAAAVLAGGEGDATAGDPRLDGALADAARARGWRGRPVPGTPLLLFTPPPRAVPPAAPGNRP